MCFTKDFGHTTLIAIFAAEINAKENITADDLGLGFDEDEIEYELKYSFSLRSLKFVGQDHCFDANGNYYYLK